VESLRVGLIGFGLAGRVFHGPLLAANPAFEVAAIVTSDPARKADAHRRHPKATIWASARTLWKHADELDLVVIASPPTTHIPLATAAIDAGLAVVVDKPLCASAAEATELVDFSADAGVPLTVFQNRRWDSDFLTLSQVAAAGELGEIRQLESRFERWKPPGSDAKAWRSLPPDQAGGVVYDLGSHLVDQAIQLLGPVTDVFAEVVSLASSAAPDDGYLELRHAGGARSRLWTSLNVTRPGPRFRVMGSDGVFVSWGLDVQESQLAAGIDPTDPGYGMPPEEQWPVVGVGVSVAPRKPVPGDYPAFYAGVAEALSSGSAMPVDPRDAVEIVRILEEAHRGFVAGPV
jgi:predicted dehydrogenase